MEERIAQIEMAVQALHGENGRLREELGALQAENRCLHEELSALRLAVTGQAQAESAEEASTPAGQWKRRLRRRWPLVAVALTIAMPLLALTVWNLDAFSSTAIGFVNGILLYYIGPRAWFLIIEGAFRAIPGVLFGQATRIAVDKFRARRGRSG